jgi:hypothetical protein
VNYIITVKYDPGVWKKYLVGADSAIAAKKEFIRLNGYDPGVPMEAKPAGTFRLDEVEVLR